jgi:hypothetical protein
MELEPSLTFWDSPEALEYRRTIDGGRDGERPIKRYESIDENRGSPDGVWSTAGVGHPGRNQLRNHPLVIGAGNH